MEVKISAMICHTDEMWQHSMYCGHVCMRCNYVDFGTPFVRRSIWHDLRKN